MSDDHQEHVAAYAADGWLTLTDAPEGTTIPTDTERYISTPEPIDVEIVR